jgi:hypothetical protein
MSRAMMAALAWACLAGAVSGCASVGAASGAVAGVVTGTATANPAVGIGVGIATQAAIDEVIKRYMRGLRHDQQEAIVKLVGDLPVGESALWQIKNTVPLDNGRGEVRVMRTFDSALARCKEFVFSMVDGEAPNIQVSWFVASACQQNQGGSQNWNWASVEPAVDRWGNLQ